MDENIKDNERDPKLLSTEERREEIAAALINTGGLVHRGELAELYGVSKMTIHNDLKSKVVIDTLAQIIRSDGKMIAKAWHVIADRLEKGDARVAMWLLEKSGIFTQSPLPDVTRNEILAKLLGGNGVTPGMN